MVSRVSLASLLVGVSADPNWTEFKAQHGRVYGEQEETSRYEIFSANAKLVDEVNSKGLPYRLAINKFADWTREEYKGLLGFVPRPIPRALHLGTHVPSGAATLPSLDWVARGAVTPVKNQGQCGSCWAFGTTGGVEGAWQVATGKLLELSEQELVDCSSANDGCNGGLITEAFAYLEGHDICSESAYPYTASGGNCRLPCSSVAIPRGGLKGYKDVQGGESGLLSAIQNQPISIAVDAEGTGWQMYSGGVMTAECGQSLDHAVLAVGYGRDGANDYWKVKNSWGTSWGEGGYIRIVRGRNSCGISNSASYPQVDGIAPPAPPGPAPPGPPCHTCSWFSWCPAGETCHYNSYDSGCCSGGPSPPPPSPPAPPSPPGPSPCDTCEYNSDCPSGQDCYYPSASATSGCCSSSPPFSSAREQVIV